MLRSLHDNKIDGAETREECFPKKNYSQGLSAKAG